MRRTGFFVAILAAIWLAATAEAVMAAGVKGAGVSGESWATLYAGPVDGSWQAVLISSGEMPKRLRITLNGRRADDLFSSNQPGIQIAYLAPDDGLQYGLNVLSVAAASADPQFQTLTSRFQVDRNQPLASAGRDSDALVLTPVQLDARQSIGPRRLETDLDWSIVAAPAGSAAVLEQSGEEGLLARFTPDLPGDYQIQLSITNLYTGAVGRDMVRVAATSSVLATPLVPVDTAATVEGRRGMAIGYHPAQENGRAPQGDDEGFFPLPAGDALQIVVLDRRTLALENQGTWSGPANPKTFSAAADFIKGFDDSSLVLMTAWADAGWRSKDFEVPFLPSYVLAVSSMPGGLIGAQTLSLFTALAYAPLKTGQMSFIGVPGFPAGSAWQVWGRPQEGEQDLATLDGFLTPDNNDNYAYLGTAPQGFDLGADGQAVSLAIGGTRYDASLPSGEGGFTVVYLNGKTLGASPYLPSEIPTQATYQTSNADGSPNIDEMNRMSADLQKLPASGAGAPPTLVAVRSIGARPLAPIGCQPPSYGGGCPPDATYADALNQLASALSGVGGVGQWIYGLATEPKEQNSFSLLGNNDSVPQTPAASQAQGAATGTAASPAPSSTHLRGLLARNKDQAYGVRGAANAPMSSALAEVSLAEPVAWPYAGTPALRCIGDFIPQLGTDPRTAYWQQPLSSADWDNILEEIKSMTASDCRAAVDATEFAAVQKELEQEIHWLVNVKSYIAALSAPFTSDGLASYADLQQVANDIYDAVTPPPQAATGISAWLIFSDLFAIAAGFDVPGTGAIAATMLLMHDAFSPTGNGPTVDYREKVRDAAAQIGKTLAQQLQAAATNSEHVVDIIAADYAKLKTVGELGNCSPQDATCPPEWQFTQTQQNAASRMYEISAKRKIWGGMMAAAYPYVLMTSSNTNAYNGTFLGPQEQISGIGCDFAKPFPVESPVFLRYGIREVANTPFLVFSQTNFKGAKGAYSPPTNYPPQSLFKTVPSLFGTLDPGGDPDKGGLGVDQFRFMVNNWPQRAQGTPAMQPWLGCGG